MKNCNLINYEITLPNLIILDLNELQIKEAKIGINGNRYYINILVFPYLENYKENKEKNLLNAPTEENCLPEIIPDVYGRSKVSG